MAFQFRCPNNHLLQGESSQAGMETVCPECQATFVIPQAVENSVAAGSANQYDFDTYELADPAPPSTPADQFNMQPETSTVDPFDQTAQQERIIHIPCPQGHLLETPQDMVGQTVLCPHCGEQFDLKESNSVEYQREKAAKEERDIRRKSKLWLNWAVAIGVIVVLFLVGLFIMAAQS